MDQECLRPGAYDCTAERMSENMKQLVNLSAKGVAIILNEPETGLFILYLRPSDSDRRLKRVFDPTFSEIIILTACSASFGRCETTQMQTGLLQILLF